MSDPVARADQAVEEVKGEARVHGAYFMQLINEGMERDEALSNLQTFMWINAGRHDCEMEDD